MKKLLLVLLVMAAPTYAQDRKVLYPIVFAVGALDAELSYRGVARGGREGNILMRPFVGNRLHIHPLMAGLGVFAVETTMWSKRRDERHWWVPVVVHIGVHSAASAWNYHQLRK